MTPQEHYDEAEWLLAEADTYAPCSKSEDRLLRRAQVHASLSLRQYELPPRPVHLNEWGTPVNVSTPDEYFTETVLPGATIMSGLHTDGGVK